MAEEANMLLLIQVHDLCLHVSVVNTRGNARLQALVQRLHHQRATMLASRQTLQLLIGAKGLTCGNNALIAN